MKNNNFNNLENGTYNVYIAKIEYVLRSILLRLLLIATLISVLIGLAYSIYASKNMSIIDIFKGIFIALMSSILIKDILKALCDKK